MDFDLYCDWMVEYSQLLMSCLEGLGCVAHVLEDLCVGAGVLQGLTLELDRGQGPVHLVQLLLQTLLPLQSHQGSWKGGA